jgi:glycosyltransferase involved in cell wall biosynthesis
MSAPGYTVFADMRWPEQTGIGQVQKALLTRKPEQVSLFDLRVRGAIGSVLSTFAISAALARAKPGDGVFLSAGFVPPFLSRIPSIVTVHDLTHLAYYGKAKALYYNLLFKQLYHHCAAIVCVSQFTRREFVGWSGIRAAKVHVVPNGVGPEFRDNCESLDLGYKYVLYPGNHRSYKNLNRLVMAFASSTLPRCGIHLVLTGSENAAIVELARRLGVERQLHFVGRVSGADLPKLYRGALLLAYVSLCEGFGIPILEAMASEVPVVTSNTTSMPEVAGDAALLVDPFSVDAIKHALDRINSESGLRTELICRGRERVKMFDWNRSAGIFWNIVNQVAGSR